MSQSILVCPNGFGEHLFTNIYSAQTPWLRLLLVLEKSRFKQNLYQDCTGNTFFHPMVLLSEGSSELAMHRISGLFYFRYPTGYLVSFSGYPAKKAGLN